MGLETGTYISDLVSANPTASDPKSQGDDHLRLIKACVKATFPNVSNAMNASHTELNYMVGVTSLVQTQINAKGAITGQAWTGSHTFPTQSAADNSTKAATTAYVDAADALKANLASPALTGTPTAPTASGGTNTTQVATTAFVVQQAFSAALPVQSGNAGKVLSTDGSNASWTLNPSLPDVIIQQQGGSADSLTSASWTTRTLNTVVRNNNTVATLSTNQITLPAGTYYIRIRAGAGAANSGGNYTAKYVTRVYNVTGSAVAVNQGEALQCGQDLLSNGVVGVTHTAGSVTLGASTALRVETYASGGAGVGGVSSGSGGTDVFTTVEIWKIS